MRTNGIECPRNEVRIHPSFEAARMQVAHDRFGGDIPRRSGCKRTAAESACRSVETANSKLQRRIDVLECAAIGVVNVQRESFDRNHGCDPLQHRGDLLRPGFPDGIGKADIVTADLCEPNSDSGRSFRVDISAEWANKRYRYVAANGSAV